MTFASRRALALAETRMEIAVATLDKIAASSLGTACMPALVQNLREVMFAAAPIKQVGLLAADGHAICSEPELPFAVKEVVSSQPVLERSDTRLGLVRLSDGQGMLRVRRLGGAAELFVLIPSSLLLPQVSLDGSAVRAYAAILGQDGTPIAASGGAAGAQRAYLRRFADETIVKDVQKMFINTPIDFPQVVSKGIPLGFFCQAATTRADRARADREFRASAPGHCRPAGARHPRCH
jgi:CSS motif domain associated with EAL